MIQATAIDTTDEVSELFDNQELEQKESKAELSEIKKKSVSGAVSYFLRTLVLNGIGLATAFLLSAFLTPEDFGIYGYVTQFVGLFVFFSDIGLAAALVQKKTEPTETDYRTAFTVQQILSWLIFGAFCILCASGIVQQKTGPVGTWLLLALGISFPLASLKTIPSIQLERKLDFNKLVLPQIVEQLVYNGVLVVFALQHVGVQSYSYAILARSLVGVAAMMIIKPWRPGLLINRQSLKELLGYGAKFQLNDFLARIKDQFFTLVLIAILPIKEFGYIQWAKNWSMYPYNLTVQNVMAITFPTFSRLQHNKPALARAIDKSIYFITLAIFPIIVGMSIFIIPLVTGNLVVGQLQLSERFGKWQPAILSLILFSIGIGWSAISTPLTNTLNAIGKINTTLKLMVMWTVLTWTLTPLFIYFFKFNGVALAALVISFTSVLPAWQLRKVVKIHIWDDVWRQLLAAVIMASVGIAGLQLWSSSIVWFLVGGMMTGAVYILSLFIIGRQRLLQELHSLRKKP